MTGKVYVKLIEYLTYCVSNFTAYTPQAAQRFSQRFLCTPLAELLLTEVPRKIVIKTVVCT